MVKTSQELKQERASKVAEQKKLLDTRKSENRAFNDDETKSFNDLNAEIEQLDADIKQREAEEAAELRAANLEGIHIGGDQRGADGEGDEPAEAFSFIRAINNARENRAHEGAEKVALEEAKDEIASRGLSIPGNINVAIPSSMLTRDITVDGDSGTKGGKLVASTPQVVMPLLPSLVLQEMGATVMSGLQGDIPLISGDEFTFSYVAETATVSGTDVEYAGPTLSPKRLSGVVDISNKWLAQTTPAAEANVKALIAAGIQSAIVKAAITGGGANGPTGLYDAITTNIQAGAAGMPTWDDIVNLETLIKSANATDKNLYYLSDPAMMGKLKTTLKASGVAGYISENGMLNGRKHIASTLVGTLDSGASHPVIYGDFGQMYVGFWSGVSFIVDPLTQAASGKTRLIFNLYNDVAVANEKAFAIRKNFTV